MTLGDGLTVSKPHILELRVMHCQFHIAQKELKPQDCEQVPLRTVRYILQVATYTVGRGTTQFLVDMHLVTFYVYSCRNAATA